MSPSGTLFFDAEGSRYFVMPAGQTLSPGELELMSLEGQVIRVDSREAEAYRVDEAVADTFIAAQAAEVMAAEAAKVIKDGAAEASGADGAGVSQADGARLFEAAMGVVGERLAPIRAAAPGLDSLLNPAMRKGDPRDPVAVLGQLLGVDLSASHDAGADGTPHPAAAGLDALAEALAQAVGHPKGALGGPSQSMDDVLTKLNALSDNLRGLPKGTQPGTAEAGPWASFLAAVETFLGASAPADPQEGYRKAAADSVDRAFKDFKLPSFRYEDLVKPPPAKEAARATEEP